MNIFYLDKNPVTAARCLCDKHISKMIVESAQLLSTAHRILDGDKRANKRGFYKSTHTNHPCGVWVRESKANYMWLWRHAVAICNEYHARYSKTHATEEVLISLSTPPKNIPSIGPTSPAQAMPEQYKNSNPVTAYRQYYLWEKRKFAEWRYSPKPEWWR